MVEGRDAQDTHTNNLEKGIDEGSKNGALAQEQETAENDHQKNYRK